MGEDAQRAARTAQVRQMGPTRGELAGPRWRHPFRGVTSPAVADGAAPRQRVYDAAELVVPGGAVGGWAAAFLLGATELDGRGLVGSAREPVVLLAPRAQHRAPRDGVRVVRSRLSADDVVEVDGIPVTSALRTTFDLARYAPVERGLAAADVMARLLGVAPDDLTGYARAHPRFRGVPVARSVAGLMDGRARSVGESRLRHVWVVEAGLPPPEVNPLVVDRWGQVVAMPDLLDLTSGLVGEYDGSTHRALAAHTADNAREERLEALGLVVVRATSIDLGPGRAALVSRLRSARARAVANLEAASWGVQADPAR